MPKWLVIGILWGAIAAVVFSAMFRGVLPAPGKVDLPVAVVLVLLYLPFVVAAGAEASVGRGSAPFAEIVGVTVAAGAGLGVLAGAATALARRLARDARNRR